MVPATGRLPWPEDRHRRRRPQTSSRCPQRRRAARSIVEQMCGYFRCYRCCTLLLYPLPSRSNYVPDLWSYRDSNSGPLACQQATPPPEYVAAGHRPTACTPVRPGPDRLRYFCAVRIEDSPLAASLRDVTPDPTTQHRTGRTFVSRLDVPLTLRILPITVPTAVTSCWPDSAVTPEVLPRIVADDGSPPRTIRRMPRSVAGPPGWHARRTANRRAVSMRACESGPGQIW